jgi:hypothetical protein
MVDVLTEIRIEPPLAVVAAFAADPSNVPRWYVNISSVTWKTEPPVGVGLRIRVGGGRGGDAHDALKTRRAGGILEARCAADGCGMRRAHRADLVKLKAVLEADTAAK